MLFDVGDILDRSDQRANSVPDLFADKNRKAWKSVSTEQARCDFAPDKWRLNSRGILFLSLWKASIYGMSLTDIKQDLKMPDFFAKNISDFFARIFNVSFNSISSNFSSWCIITPPPRRHLENNFAINCAEKIAEITGINFFRNVARAKSRQRVNAVFDLINTPPYDNIICFDDIVTTGSTFQAMDRLLKPFSKNIIYLTAINNKL